MTLLDEWTQETVKVLQKAYPEASKGTLEAFARKCTDGAKKPVAKLRSIYKLETFDVALNDLSQYIEEKNLIIGANGSLSEHPSNDPSVVSMKLVSLMADRKKYKDLVKEAIEQKDDEKKKINDIFQNFVKIVMNSFYGIQLQSGSFLYNPDSASFITKQAQNLIAEMMWSLEQFLGANHGFIDLNEFFKYLQFIADYPINKTWDEYVTSPATDQDIVDFYTSVAFRIPGYAKSEAVVKDYLIRYAKNLTQDQKNRVFYKNNLLVFLERNHRVFEEFKKIVLGSESFVTPEHIPTSYRGGIELINHICEEFVISMQSNSNRVMKFLKNKRRVVLNSDTDSVFVHLGVWVDWFNAKLGFEKHHDEDDDNYLFRIVNLLSTIATNMQEKKILVYCENSRVPKDLQKYIKMKNEFLFKRQIAYPVKKNYAIWKKLREGKVIDDVDYTGLKLNGTKMSPYVRALLNDIIENDILRKDLRLFDPRHVYMKVKQAHNEIQFRLKSGDMTLGGVHRFSGTDGYKEILQEATGRGCLIWNILFENDPIVEGEKAYRFDTRLATEEDLAKIPDLQIRELLKTKIFHNPDHPGLAKYGLTKICIPMYGYTKVIPPWLIPFLDTRDMADKHLEPITSLLPSIGLYQSKTASFTPLIPL